MSETADPSAPAHTGLARWLDALVQRLPSGSGQAPTGEFLALCWAILAAAGVVSAGMVLTAALMVAQEREAAIDAAQKVHSDLVASNESRIRYTLSALDKVLLVVRQDLQTRGLPSREALLRRLEQLQLGNERDPTAVIIGPGGDVLRATAADGPAARINVADRDYFQSHLRNTDDGLHVGRPVQSRLTGKWVLPLTLRVGRPDGSFGGIVFLGVDPDILIDPQQQTNLGEHSQISLIGLDGFARVRRVGASLRYADDVRQAHVLQEAKRASFGAYVATSSIDGVERAVSYRVIERYALVLLSGTAMEEILQTVAGRTRGYMALCLLGLALLWLFSLLLLASMWRQRQAYAALQGSATRYQMLFENTPVMNMVVASRNGQPTLIDCNQRFAQVMGAD